MSVANVCYCFVYFRRWLDAMTTFLLPPYGNSSLVCFIILTSCALNHLLLLAKHFGLIVYLFKEMAKQSNPRIISLI
jgi:hypothetical protein